MKTLALFIFTISLVVVISIVSCRGRSYYSLVELNVPEGVDSVADDNRLFGEWQACTIMKDGYSIQMNVCPGIVFSRGGSGFVRSASGAIEGFTWKLRSGKLSIVRSMDIPDGMFADTSYSVAIKYDKGHYDAVLESIYTKETFYLGR